MSINRFYFYFHLSNEGWSKALPNAEDTVPQIAAASLISLRMIEFSSDDKPDMWYKAEIVNVHDRSHLAKKAFEKFGLPKVIRHHCFAEIDELQNKLQKEFLP